jgi:pyruvate dehydrogenase E2 component (dihydrolipoamide acetyltransferase)
MAVEKLLIPDFGDVQEIAVVEIFIAVGDTVEVEDSLIALESEKAVMDIPATLAGVIKEILVKEDDVVSSGDVIALIETAGSPEVNEDAAKDTDVAKDTDAAPEAKVPAKEKDPVKDNGGPVATQKIGAVSHATPSVRIYAREQSVDLGNITGNGPNGRILHEDVLAAAGKAPAAAEGQGFSLPVVPLEDFSKYGEVEELALGRIKKISGPYLHRSWVTVPHVTHFDEADITEIEEFRKDLNASAKEGDVKFSPLIFITKAVAATLKAFPFFNCSLVPDGDKVILKKFYNVGIAVDTPEGLVVPVVKDVDKKSLTAIAEDVLKLSTNARVGKLGIADMQGATFTISSLGGIGGTGFTPIISSPQVAILGLSRSFMKPHWDGEKFVPRLTLPFSVSYDHRVIDGAEAARFCKTLRMNIEDMKRTLI